MELRVIKKTFHEKDDIVGCLNYTKTPYRNCTAWCEMKGAYLTKTQMKNKGCLGKQCRALAIIPEHPFWKQRAEKLASKKAKKQVC